MINKNNVLLLALLFGCFTLPIAAMNTKVENNIKIKEKNNIKIEQENEEDVEEEDQTPTGTEEDTIIKNKLEEMYKNNNFDLNFVKRAVTHFSESPKIKDCDSSVIDEQCETILSEYVTIKHLSGTYDNLSLFKTNYNDVEDKANKFILKKPVLNSNNGNSSYTLVEITQKQLSPKEIIAPAPSRFATMTKYLGTGIIGFIMGAMTNMFKNYNQVLVNSLGLAGTFTLSLLWNKKINSTQQKATDKKMPYSVLSSVGGYCFGKYIGSEQNNNKLKI